MVESTMNKSQENIAVDIENALWEGDYLVQSWVRGDDSDNYYKEINGYRKAVLKVSGWVSALEEENARLKEQVSQLTESLEEASTTCTLMKQQQRESWVQPERPAPCARSCEANAFRIKIRELESMLKS